MSKRNIRYCYVDSIVGWWGGLGLGFREVVKGVGSKLGWVCLSGRRFGGSVRVWNESIYVVCMYLYF